MIVRAGARLIQATRYVLGAVLLAAVLLNFVNVAMRYLFLRPIIWAEEVMQFATIWMVLLGAAVVTWQGTHLKMEVLYDLSPARARQAISLLIAVVTLLLSLFIIYQAFQMIEALQRNNQHSVAARIPLAQMYLAIPLGFALGIVALVIRMWDLARGGEGRRPEGQPPASRGLG